MISSRVRYQEIALTLQFSPSAFPPEFEASSCFVFVVFFLNLFLFCCHSLSYLLVLTFQFLVICTISLSFPPIRAPSRSIHTTLVPTGIVIPSPQRRLNDFILLRLCLLLLMMCLVPSYFDVDYQSPLLCVGSEEGKIMCEQFRGEQKKKKSRMVAG